MMATAKQSRPAVTKRSREATLSEAAAARGWTLEKIGKKFRLVASNETIVADDWSTNAGLTLDAIAEALSDE